VRRDLVCGVEMCL